jgi:hypothetical protein
MRRSICIAVLGALALAACGGRDDREFDRLPRDQGASGPAGQWVAADGRRLGLLISQEPHGAWIVESFGVAHTGQGGNACWRIHVGSLDKAELIASGDLDVDFYDRAIGSQRDRLTRTKLESYEGLFVEFRGDRARVSGPESKARECPLAGVYIRRAGNEPTLSYHSSQMPGPGMGDERVGAFANPNARPVR